MREGMRGGKVEEKEEVKDVVSAEQFSHCLYTSQRVSLKWRLSA